RPEGSKAPLRRKVKPRLLQHMRPVAAWTTLTSTVSWQTGRSAVVVKYPLKGGFKVTAKGRDYWYAWRGPPLGPRLQGAPGSPEFHASYVETHEALRAPDSGRFRSLVAAYRASNDYKQLAPSTKQAWARWLDRVD